MAVVGLLGNKYVQMLLLGVALVLAYNWHVKAMANEAVKLASKDATIAALTDKLAEEKRQRVAAEVALQAEAERSVARTELAQLNRIEVDGYQEDLAGGLSRHCPADDAYARRMLAIHPGHSGEPADGNQPAAPAGQP